MATKPIVLRAVTTRSKLQPLQDSQSGPSAVPYLCVCWKHVAIPRPSVLSCISMDKDTNTMLLSRILASFLLIPSLLSATEKPRHWPHEPSELFLHHHPDPVPGRAVPLLPRRAQRGPEPEPLCPEAQDPVRPDPGGLPLPLRGRGLCQTCARRQWHLRRI